MGVVEATICLFVGMFLLLMSFYLGMCFVCWINDIVIRKPWKYWFK